MSSSFDKFQKRRLLSSYFSVVLSIALVLFLLGMLGLLVLNTKKLADHFKEQVAITVFLKDKATKEQITELKDSISKEPYTKTATFISKEEAAKKHSEEIGENFVEFLGYNPLQNSIDIHLKADYVVPDSLENIGKKLSAKGIVAEVSYDKPLISLLYDNVKRISMWVLIISAVFTLIAVLLINSSIRLSVYSNRFIIKTMQMVGATKSFIRKPFILKSVKLGMIGAGVAIIALALALYYINIRFPQLNLLEEPVFIVFIFIGIFILGILITWLSTLIATQRFLNLRTDDLYY